MPRGKHTIVVLLLCLLALVTTALGTVLLLATWTVSGTADGHEPATSEWGVRGFLIFVAVTLTAVGAIVATWRPANPIGWLYLGCGVLSGIQFFFEEAMTFGSTAPSRALPGTDVMAWVALWIWVPTVGTIATFPFLLFPNGRLPSRRWRPVAWIAGIGILLMTVAFMASPDPTNMTNMSPANTGSPIPIDQTIAGWMLAAGAMGMASAAILSVVSLLVRFRRAKDLERQQLKWIASAGAFLAISLAVGMMTSVAIEPWLGYFVKIDDLFLIAGILGVPVASGIAILRHGLWEIDLLINRALVYTLLTGALVAFYFGSVVTLQQLFRALTGQQSDLAVVISTLAIAALFLPLRRRIQHFIDRRFYRQKYDAARTLAAFGAAMRDEVDLPVLTSEMVRVVRDTVQPAHVFLWLRSPRQHGDRSSATEA